MFLCLLSGPLQHKTCFVNVLVTSSVHNFCADHRTASKASAAYVWLQLVYPAEAMPRLPQQLLQHPNMSAYAYQVPQSELELRESIRDPTRKTGMNTKGQQQQFGLPLHTQIMLNDRELYKQLQVRLA